MHRALFGIVALSILLVAGPAVAGEDDSDAKTIVIHDLKDLAQGIPDLAGTLAGLAPGADVVLMGPGVFLVKADPGAQADLSMVLEGLRRNLGAPGRADDAGIVERALASAQADAETLALLRNESLELTFENASLLTLATTLAQTVGLNVMLSPKASKASAGVGTSASFRAAHARQLLDFIVRQAGVTWTLENGIVRILTLDEAGKVRVSLDFVNGILEEEIVEDETDVDIDRDHPPESSQDLKSMVRALAEEVRALRKEVKEVRSILEEMRSR